MSRASRLAFVCIGLLTSGPAAAHVVCSVSSTGVAFGVYDPRSGTALDGAGTINVSCDQGASNVTITADGGGSGNKLSRRMTNGVSNLSYNLYTNSGRTSVFGDGTGGTSLFSFNSVNNSVSVSVYGRVAGSQNVTAGSYSDTLIMTVTF